MDKMIFLSETFSFLNTRLYFKANLRMILAFLLVILFLCYTGLILFYALSWAQLKLFTYLPGKTIPTLPLTIVIPARNEAANIETLLQSIFVQNYPAHLQQIIVIDDHSTDDTAAIVNKFIDKNVLLLQLKDFVFGKLNSYKKKAIEVALAHATGELIVTTDADCITPRNWLHTIAQYYNLHEPAFIAMPVVFTNNGSPLQIFQSLDFMTLQGITGASVQAGAHSMCNGANLAYTREAFEKVNGFEGISDIASGDDMLLMYKIAKAFPAKIAFIKSPDVIVTTAPMRTLKSFLNQRIRWASKADKYEDKRITVVLALVYIFNATIFFVPFVCFWFNPVLFNRINLFDFWVLIFILKIIIELIFLFPVAAFFGKQILLWWFSIAQPFHLIYTIIAGWLGKFGKYNWKNRIVK